MIVRLPPLTDDHAWDGKGSRRPKADIDTECEKCLEQPNPPFETFGDFQLADHH